MQTYRGDNVAADQALLDHPDPEARKLATAVLVNAFKAIAMDNDRREIEESARFFADTSERGLLHFWLKTQMAEDPQGSQRMATCKKLGDNALYACRKTTHVLKERSDDKRLWVTTFRKLLDADELVGAFKG